MDHIVITGGSRGIGAAAVRTFSALGHQVYFLYKESHQLAQALEKETGAKALCADLADGEAVRQAFSQIGQVDVLINNAGICDYGLISQITDRQWQHLFDVNVHGSYRCIVQALPSMLQRQQGCIINVSSMWGQVGASCEVCYSATKGAVLAMTKALAKELGPSGIRVNAIAPGVIQTDMTAQLSCETLEALRQDTPIGRLGEPADVVRAMVYLTQADFVTGQVLGVSGGFVID